MTKVCTILVDFCIQCEHLRSGEAGEDAYDCAEAKYRLVGSYSDVMGMGSVPIPEWCPLPDAEAVVTVTTPEYVYLDVVNDPSAKVEL